jgi:hypothetical protein
MNVFDSGDPTGGLKWLASESLPAEATPVNLYELDVTRLPIAGPCDVAWFGGDAA